MFIACQNCSLDLLSFRTWNMYCDVQLTLDQQSRDCNTFFHSIPNTKPFFIYSKIILLRYRLLCLYREKPI